MIYLSLYISAQINLRKLMYRHIHNTLHRSLADQSEIGYIHEMSEKKCYRGLFIEDRCFDIFSVLTNDFIFMS